MHLYRLFRRRPRHGHRDSGTIEGSRRRRRSAGKQQRHNGECSLFLGAGGSVANTGKGALIQGDNGVYVGGTAGAVTSSGTIIGKGRDTT